ncbi:clathrin associated protein complex large subunit, partial [Cladochytrium tenue]
SIRSILSKFRTHQDVEIQSRAVEFMAIARLDAETRAALLERMPVLDSAVREEALKGTGQAPASPTAAGGAKAGRAATAATAAAVANVLDLGNDLLGLSVGGTAAAGGGAAAAPSGKPADDVLGIMFGGGSAAAPTSTANVNNIMDLLGGLGSTPAAAKTTAPLAGGATNDLLGDLFGGTPAAKPSGSAFSPTSGAAASALASDLLGVGVGGASPTSASAAAGVPRSYVAYERNGLKVTLAARREDSGRAMAVRATFEHAAGSPGGTVTGLAFQVAVTKQLRLTMQPPSGNMVPAGGSATQVMRIENPSRAPVKLRMKISFALGGKQIEDIADFAGFDQALWAA